MHAEVHVPFLAAGHRNRPRSGHGRRLRPGARDSTTGTRQRSKTPRGGRSSSRRTIPSTPVPTARSPRRWGSVTGFLRTDSSRSRYPRLRRDGAAGNLNAVRHFDTVDQLRAEIIDARVWAGLHALQRFDQGWRRPGTKRRPVQSRSSVQSQVDRVPASVSVSATVAFDSSRSF